MSIRVMTAAWDVDLPATEKLVLLALADNANDAGQCWPSAMTIARKCGQGERTVRRAIQSLIAKGHLEQRQRSGTSPMYHVHPCQSGTPANPAPLPERPDTPANPAPKPSGTVIPKKDKPSLGKRPTRVPADFIPIMTGKTKAVVDGWPPGRLEDEVEHFIDHHTAKGTLSYDWQASWRTWVKNSKKWNPTNGNGSRYTGPKPNPQSPADAIFAARRSLGIDGGDMGFDASPG